MQWKTCTHGSLVKAATVRAGRLPIKVQLQLDPVVPKQSATQAFKDFPLQLCSDIELRISTDFETQRTLDLPVLRRLHVFVVHTSEEIAGEQVDWHRWLRVFEHSDNLTDLIIEESLVEENSWDIYLDVNTLALLPWAKLESLRLFIGGNANNILKVLRQCGNLRCLAFQNRWFYVDPLEDTTPAHFPLLEELHLDGVDPQVLQHLSCPNLSDLFTHNSLPSEAASQMLAGTRKLKHLSVDTDSSTDENFADWGEFPTQCWNDLETLSIHTSFIETGSLLPLLTHWMRSTPMPFPQLKEIIVYVRVHPPDEVGPNAEPKDDEAVHLLMAFVRKQLLPEFHLQRLHVIFDTHKLSTAGLDGMGPVYATLRAEVTGMNETGTIDAAFGIGSKFPFPLRTLR